MYIKDNQQKKINQNNDPNKLCTISIYGEVYFLANLQAWLYLNDNPAEEFPRHFVLKLKILSQ